MTMDEIPAVTVSAQPTKGGAYRVSLAPSDWVKIGGAFGANLIAVVVIFTRLTTTVQTQGDQIGHVSQDVASLSALVRESREAVARIEGQLKSK